MRAKSWRRWGGWLVMGLLWGGVRAEENVTPTEATTAPPSSETPPETEPWEDTYGLGSERFSLAKEMKLALGGEGNPSAVEAIEKEFGVLQDEALVQRVNEIGAKVVAAAMQVGPQQVIVDAVAPGAEAPKLLFAFKVLNSTEVNAFSIWGGHIYVTKGLLDYVQSNDELAAVIGHELGHAMRHHLNKQQRVERKAGDYQMWVILAGWFGGDDVDVGSVFLASEWAKYAVMSAHSVRDETEADYLGVLYCYRAGYNPVGLLTFMQRLARDATAGPDIRENPLDPGLGATQTHPWSDDRARSIRHQITEQLHLPVEIFKVITPPHLEARAATVNGTEIAELVFGDRVIFQPAAPGEQDSPLARAQALADELLRLVSQQGLHARHLRLDRQKPLLEAFLRGKEVAILEILPGDAEFHGKDARALAQEAFNALKGAMQVYELRNQKI